LLQHLLRRLHGGLGAGEGRDRRLRRLRGEHRAPALTTARWPREGPARLGSSRRSPRPSSREPERPQPSPGSLATRATTERFERAVSSPLVSASVLAESLVVAHGSGPAQEG